MQDRIFCGAQFMLYFVLFGHDFVIAVADPRGGAGGWGPPLTPKVETPHYILRPKLHLLTHK